MDSQQTKIYCTECKKDVTTEIKFRRVGDSGWKCKECYNK